MPNSVSSHATRGSRPVDATIKQMTGRILLALVTICIGCPWAAEVKAESKGAHPDFEGVWTTATATPLERPARLKDKQVFSPEEAAEWERQAAARNQDPAEAKKDTFASYNALFYEHGTKLSKTLRTSIITDPPDGRIPALTPAAAAEKTRRQDLLRHASVPRDLGLQDQCIVFVSAVPPMLPYIYNSNYQIIRTDREVMINVEMIHDTRVIRLDRQTHLSPDVRLWLGDSIGHWEGGTLVVDTTNFKEGGGFFGEAGGMYASDKNLHVVERFSQVDRNTILYRFEVDDPTVYTRPWKGELTMEQTRGPIYEYACHEGNYALPDLLNGFRVERGESAPKTK